MDNADKINGACADLQSRIRWNNNLRSEIARKHETFKEEVRRYSESLSKEEREAQMRSGVLIPSISLGACDAQGNFLRETNS